MLIIASEIFVQSYDGGFSNTITCSHYHEQTNLCYDYPENCAIQVVSLLIKQGGL